MGGVLPCGIRNFLHIYYGGSKSFTIPTIDSKYYRRDEVGRNPGRFRVVQLPRNEGDPPVENTPTFKLVRSYNIASMV